MTTSLKPTESDIEMLRGDPKAVTFKFADPILDITNDTVVFTVYDGINGDVVFTKSNGVGEHADPDAADGGTTTFTMAEADTAPASLTARTAWRYEVERSGEVSFYGAFFIDPRAKEIAQP